MDADAFGKVKGQKSKGKGKVKGGYLTFDLYPLTYRVTE
jgi:hypothetical protein